MSTGYSPFSVFVALQSDSRVLIVRDKISRKTVFPGGRGREGEDVISAAIRKVKEEVNVDVGRRSLGVVSQRVGGGRKDHYLVSGTVRDEFLNALPRVGPTGLVVTVCERSALAQANLAPHIVELIQNMQHA